MRLVTFSYRNEERVGALIRDDTEIVPLPYPNMQKLIEQADFVRLREQLEAACARGERICAAGAKLLAPIPVPRQDILCIGRNYWDHAQESARYNRDAEIAKSEVSVYFSKRVNRATASGDPIWSHGSLTQKLDYEAELAVVLGKTAARVPAAQAADYIFGYTVINDVSARDQQYGHKQWYVGKSLDSFAPMGPCLVTADEFGFPPELNIRSRVNGELRQNSNTSLFIHSIPAILEELSAGMTLLPGTILATGTPGGVGMGFDPPRFLRPGDEIECEIEGIGCLRNRVEEGGARI